MAGPSAGLLALVALLALTAVPALSTKDTCNAKDDPTCKASSSSPSTSSSSSSSSSSSISATPDAAKNDTCPGLVKPTDIHFMVINLDRSSGRLARMRAAFRKNKLPDFQRVPGLEVKESLIGTDAYPVPRLTPYLKIADYGTCLAHYGAWKAVYEGKHRWVIILEDDADFVPGVNLLDFPLVPKDADLVLLRASTVVQSHEVCAGTSVLRATWGYGMVGYLTSRAGAWRLMKAAAKGFNSPLDGHVWHHNNTLYTTATNYIDHGSCANPCPSSIRTYLNGEVPVEPD